MTNTDLVQTYRNVDAGVKTFFESIKNQLSDEVNKWGYEVFYGPPVARPPILFIGFNPGVGRDDGPYYRPLQPWPDKCSYVVHKYDLAELIKKIVPIGMLSECSGINTIFLRSPSEQRYINGVQPYAIREKIERYCCGLVSTIVRETDPQRIVVIGFNALRNIRIYNVFGDRPGVLVDGKEIGGFRAWEKWNFAGREVMVTYHLSGSHHRKREGLFEAVKVEMHNYLRIETDSRPLIVS